MTSRRLIFAFFLCIALFIRINAQTVYVSETGKRYHAKNCSLAKTGKKGMPLQEARKAGYTPCKACKAEEIKAAEEKKKPSVKK